MPYQRPTLSQLRQQVAADISSLITGADGLLRFGNLPVLADALAGLANLHYGYLDWISKNSVPFTCTGEFLEGWAGLIGITREAPTAASGTVTFTGTNGVTIPSGALVVRSDQRSYTTNSSGTVSGGSVTVTITDQTPGSAGNTDVGTAMSLGNAIAGISSSGVVAGALVGGADVETDDSLRARMLQRFQNPPQGGDAQDYVTWALQVNGITRVWPLRNGQGAGTVVVFFMMDIAESLHDGFPQGADGVATDETRDFAATGDQLILANYLFDLQPVTALVYSSAPTPSAVNFTIGGLLPNTADIKTAVAAAISDVFLREGSPLNTPIYLADIEAALNAIPGIVDFIISTPAGDVTVALGSLPVLGTITYT